jgi:hypothetical protein
MIVEPWKDKSIAHLCAPFLRGRCCLFCSSLDTDESFLLAKGRLREKAGISVELRCITYLNGNSSDLLVRGDSTIHIKSIWREKKSETYAAFNNNKSNPEILTYRQVYMQQ